MLGLNDSQGRTGHKGGKMGTIAGTMYLLYP